MSFHEGPKYLFQKGPKCPKGAEVVGAEVVGVEVSKTLKIHIKCYSTLKFPVCFILYGK